MNCQTGGGAGGGPLGEGARGAAGALGGIPEGTSLMGATASLEELHPRKSWRQQGTPL